MNLGKNGQTVWNALNGLCEAFKCSERFTEWVGEGAERKAIPRQDRRDIGDKDCLNRLGTYEDVIPLEYAQELTKAVTDGRLYVSPCKMGEVWQKKSSGKLIKIKGFRITPMIGFFVIYGLWNPKSGHLSCDLYCNVEDFVRNFTKVDVKPQRKPEDAQNERVEV